MEEDHISHKENSSFFSITSENEFFREMYSYSNLKVITIATFFFGTIFGLVLEFGIIWYEKYGNHRYRTVINRLFAFMSKLVVTYIFFVYIPEGTRYIVGPLNETFCDAHNILKNVLSISIVLTLDLIVIIRYICIFKHSNFAVINDDLLAVFFQITILVVGTWMAVLKRMSIGKQPLNYYMCCGKNPSAESSSKMKKFDTFGIVVVLSFVMHIYALTKIFFYQREMENINQNINLGQLSHSNANNRRHNEERKQEEVRKFRNIPKSIVDLSTQVLCVLFNVIFVAIITTMNQIEPSKLNNYENRWLAYFIQIIGIAICIIGIALQYYIKNYSAMKKMW